MGKPSGSTRNGAEGDREFTNLRETNKQRTTEREGDQEGGNDETEESKRTECDVQVTLEKRLHLVLWARLLVRAVAPARQEPSRALRPPIVRADRVHP